MSVGLDKNYQKIPEFKEETETQKNISSTNNTKLAQRVSETPEIKNLKLIESLKGNFEKTSSKDLAQYTLTINNLTKDTVRYLTDTTAENILFKSSLKLDPRTKTILKHHYNSYASAQETLQVLQKISSLETEVGGLKSKTFNMQKTIDDQNVKIQLAEASLESSQKLNTKQANEIAMLTQKFKDLTTSVNNKEAEYEKGKASVKKFESTLKEEQTKLATQLEKNKQLEKEMALLKNQNEKYAKEIKESKEIINNILSPIMQMFPSIKTTDTKEQVLEKLNNELGAIRKQRADFMKMLGITESQLATTDLKTLMSQKGTQALDKRNNAPKGVKAWWGGYKEWNKLNGQYELINSFINNLN